MIYSLVTARHAYTWDTFLASWGKPLRERVALLTYESVLEQERDWDVSGIHVFCDLDRLPLASLVTAARLHTGLSDACGSARVLNHPSLSMQRFLLLRTLHAAGLNRFAVQRTMWRELPEKFPALIRPARGSPQAPLLLLADAAAYRAALARFRQGGALPNDLITVEFCDTADRDGVYRKYGAFVVGGTIVPRHVFFSRNWTVKFAELTSAQYLAEEHAYLDANPHAQALARVARIAGISYGRIDYSMLDGEVQTWEINTNPMIASNISEEVPARHEIQLKFLALFTRAFDALEGR